MIEILFFIFLILEIIIFFFIKKFKKNFKWLITPEDEFPFKNQEELDEFLNFNYSKELGWDRKPGSKGKEINQGKETYFEITNDGYRKTGNNFNITRLATFGDSYTFCRYVNDDETWQSYLEKKTNFNVRNYGVGNFGIDQAFIKYETTKIEPDADIILFGFVPETISRIHSYWKHFLEFGNKFAFKPIFRLNDQDELYKIESYLNKNKSLPELRKNIREIKKLDVFYKKKFKKRMFKFPYTISFTKNFFLNIKIFKNLLLNEFNFSTNNENYLNKAQKIVINKNIEDANLLYNDSRYTKLLEKLIYQYDELIRKRDKKFILLFIPQRHDLELAIKNKSNYRKFLFKLSKNINIIDLTTTFLDYKDSNILYLEDNYAGHLSKIGNEVVANTIYKFLKNNNLLN